PLTAPTELSAIAAPSAFACLREASTRSNATTLWPALTRLAAIGPPMLPRPMNAIFAISNPPLETCLVWSAKSEFVGADLGEIRRDHCRRHVLDQRRRPFWTAVLVDHGSAHAL